MGVQEACSCECERSGAGLWRSSLWSAGLQKIASLQSCPRSQQSTASTSEVGRRRPSGEWFLWQSLGLDSCLGCGPGEEAVELTGNWVGFFGFNFSFMTLGKSHCLWAFSSWTTSSECLSSFKKVGIFSAPTYYCTGDECVVSTSPPFCYCL